ncbi:hypothetical protein CH279_18660 [Rhodococcus sp. 06-412-2B]|nr:hypothetical protein CH279_18660 [Rhodococcus sp. 06-412-2B]
METETEVEPVVTDRDQQAIEPEANVEIESLRRQLEALQVEHDTTKGTLAAATTELDGLRLTQLKETVARENGLPAGVLAGSDRAELEAHAEILREWSKSHRGVDHYRKSMTPTSGLSTNRNAPAYEGSRERAVRALGQIFSSDATGN